MGLAISSLFDKLFSKREYRVLLLGLDNAGKTTILFNLKLGEVVASVPTVGFNVEKLEYKNVEFSAWDVGGQDKIRRLWKHYYDGTDALIYVVDSSDTDRIEESRKELAKLLDADELKDASVLVYANKQDMPQAVNCSRMSEAMGLHKLRGREWYIQGCCGTNGDGLHAGLDWLVDALARKK